MIHQEAATKFHGEQSSSHVVLTEGSTLRLAEALAGNGVVPLG